MSQKKLTSFLATVNESSSADCEAASVYSENQDADVDSLLSSETDLDYQGHEDEILEESTPCECPCCTDLSVHHAHFQIYD